MKAVYKCRLCGEVYRGGGTAIKEVATLCMEELVVGVRGREPMAPAVTAVHHCGGDHAGSLGMADFQGWEKEE